MRIAYVFAVLVLLPAPTLLHAEPPTTPKANNTPGLLEVALIGTIDVNGKVSFNQGRQYAISVNHHLPDAKAAWDKLVAALEEQKQLDQIVFGWFGKKPPARLNLKIGNKVPVDIAQAVVGAYAVGAKIPVHIELMTVDEQPGSTRWVFVGSLVDCDTDPVTPQQIRELLKAGITREEFTKLLPKK